MESYLSDLNTAQMEAVQHGYGPLLVFAGAGSGKTRVLTRRIAHIIRELGASPGEILAVTFTNKAAREMKQRVDALFPGRALPIWVSTFHSACVRILRQNARYLEYSPRFVIYDSADAMSALKRVYKKLGIDPKIVEPRMVMSAIDRAKNDYKFPEQVKGDFYLGREFAQTVAELYENYQEELRKSDAMDFGDLICNVVTLFKLEPKVLEAYQQRFKFLLVDEYQDTNHVQYLLIRQLTQLTQNICVVGDDDQSIYGFRGANVETILSFRKDFPEAHVVTLDTNYRSTKNILDAANSVIAQNSRRQEKTMRTPNPQGAPIRCFKAFDEQDEAEFVARELSALFQNGIEPEETAVFYRTNAQSRAIEEALLQCGIPYQIFGGHRFYDRKEIKDVLGYYRLLLNPKDNEAFLRVINTPTRGIGPTAVAALSNAAAKRGESLLETLEKAAEVSPPFSKAQLAKYQEFADLISRLRKEADQAEADFQEARKIPNPYDHVQIIGELLRSIAEKTGYIKSLQLQDPQDNEGRIENINELCRVAIDFVQRNFEQGACPTLTDFLDRASLSSQLETENSAVKGDGGKRMQGHVSIMTLHLAKGLEFDSVFLVGMEEGLLPHVRSLDDRQALEEERRLCYVGLTRAKRALHISRATDRQSFGRSNWYTGIPSRFIKELPVEVLEDKRSGFLNEF